jgi:hypothetical protein
MSDVVAQVGEDTRRSGRMSADRIIEKIRKEKDAIVEQLKQLEFSLSDVEDWKRRETSRVLSKRLPKSQSMTACAAIDSEARERKAPFSKERRILESRLHDINSRLATAHTRKSSEVNDTLLRIERLLVTLIRRLPGV